MKRKFKKPSSANCGGNTAKKNTNIQLEWDVVISGAFRWLAHFNTAWRAYEIAKSLIEQSNLLI